MDACDSSARGAPAAAGDGWDLGATVAALRAARGERDGAWAASAGALPSRAAVAAVVRDLRAVLFPKHFGETSLHDDAVDYYVGSVLEGALRSLREQVERSLCLEAPDALAEAPRRAREITREFVRLLPDIRRTLDADALAAWRGDPAAQTLDEVLFCYPGVTAVTHHRIAHALYALGAPLLARIIAEISHASTGIDIHPGARIGPSFFIDHGTGVVIGETCVIGERVRLYQGVTLGARSFPTDSTGALVKGAPRHPVVEDDVVIYSGATVLGRITVGRGSSIGGNVWRTRSVPPGSVVTQAQHRSESFCDGGGI